MTHRTNLCLAAIVAAGITGTTSADTFTPDVSWNNAGADGDWDTAAAWSTGTEPVDSNPAATSSDKVAIDNGATVTVNSPGNSADNLRLASEEGTSGFMEITGGGLDLRVFRVGDEDEGAVNQSAGDVTVEAQFWVGARGAPLENSEGDGTYNLSGGTLTITGASASNTRVGRAGAIGEFNHTGGTFESSRDDEAGGLWLSTAAGAAATATGSYHITGATSVMTIKDELVVDAGGGDATFSITGVGPTITLGSYAQGDGGTLSFVTDATGVSSIVVSADLQTDDDVSLDGDLLVDLSALTASPGVIVLIDNQSINAIAGVFDNAAEGTVFGAYTLTYLYDSGDGNANDLALVIPEPGSLILFGLGGLALMLRRGG